MKRVLICVALLSAAGCSTLSRLPLFSRGDSLPGDVRTSRGAMSGPDGPGTKVKPGFTW